MRQRKFSKKENAAINKMMNVINGGKCADVFTRDEIKAIYTAVIKSSKDEYDEMMQFSKDTFSMKIQSIKNMFPELQKKKK